MLLFHRGHLRVFLEKIRVRLRANGRKHLRVGRKNHLNGSKAIIVGRKQLKVGRKH